MFKGQDPTCAYVHRAVHVHTIRSRPKNAWRKNVCHVPRELCVCWPYWNFVLTILVRSRSTAQSLYCTSHESCGPYDVSGSTLSSWEIKSMFGWPPQMPTRATDFVPQFWWSNRSPWLKRGATVSTPHQTGSKNERDLSMGVCTFSPFYFLARSTTLAYFHYVRLSPANSLFHSLSYLLF